MPKTPDEIKKGLIEPELFCSQCEYSGEPHGCNRPNGSCTAWDNADDAYHLIQQLQADNAEKDQKIRQLETQNAELLTKVEQLQAEKDVLDYTLAGVMHSVDKWLDVEPYKIDGPTGNDAVTRAVLAREIALKAIEQAQAERDAAVKAVPRACAYCKWYGLKNGGFFPDCKNPNGCRNISGINTGWEWRGVQKEE